MILLYIAIFTGVFVLYGAMIYYIGAKGLLLINALNFSVPRLGYWIFLWFVAFSFFVGRATEKWLPSQLVKVTELIGAFWLGIMTYSVLILFIGEIIFLVNRRLEFIPKDFISSPRFVVVTGLAIITLISIIVSWGWWNARNPKIIHYDIQLAKESMGYEELNIVLLSDLHLGRLVDRSQLEKIVAKVKSLEPDLVLMPGDIIDDRVDEFVEQNMMEVFNTLATPLGVYASMGNHEYIGGQAHKVEKYFAEAGITVLRDEYVKVNDSLYLVGREDVSARRFLGKNRKPIEQILNDVDKNLPIIMLDHQPVGIEEVESAGVDLMVSGHTHRGQLFPFRLFTKRIFLVDWGYEQIDNLHLVVTSGAGTWGPPLRVGHRSEIVSITLKFK